MTAAQILIVVVALLAANLPFLTQRVFLGIPLVWLSALWPLAKSDTDAAGISDINLRAAAAEPTHPSKRFSVRLVELVCLYFLVGGAARLLEAQAYASAYSQRWEFYAITLCLFLVLAYPGFVFRYLWQRRSGDGR